MAEVNAAEAEQKAEASFGEGFGVTPPVESAKVVEETKVEPVVEPAAAAPVTPAPAPEKPRYAKVLQSDFDNLKAAAGKVSSLESQVAKLTGTLGNTEQLEQRIVEKVKALTPAGQPVELSDEDFAELIDYAPEVATATRAALEKVLKKAGVRGTGTQAPGQDVEKVVESILSKRERQREVDDFVEAYPEWEKIVGKVAMEKGEVPDPNNPFRAWVETQDDDFKKMVNTTNSPRALKGAIDKFMASQKAPVTPATPNRAAARRAIMEDAVTPRTDGSPPPINQPPNVDDAFEQGFKQARAH
jgi:hypothetical protein